MVARRVILQGGLVLPLAAACGPEILRGNSGSVRIAVSWSGNELAAFRKVLAGLAAAQTFNGRVEVLPLGDDIDTALSAGGRDAPDIVMLPDPGPIQRLAGTALAPLPATLWSYPQEQPFYSEPWRELLWHNDCDGRADLYGVPFKAANMSLVWYDKSAFDGYDSSTFALPADQSPDGWPLAQWPGRIGEFAAARRHLFALGAADGWVLAYHFANLLQAIAPNAYRALSIPGDSAGRCASPVKSTPRPADWNDRDVQQALRMLGEIWCVRGAFAGGVAEPLRRQFPDAVRDVFQHRHAAMVIAPDYAEPIVRECLRRTGRDARSVGVFGFPGLSASATADPHNAPDVGGGDVMVMTKYAAPQAKDLITALAAPNASEPWVSTLGGFIPPHTGAATPDSYTNLFRDVAGRMRDWTVFDFADVVGPRGRRDGLWFILTRFLMDVGDRGAGAVDAAVKTAIGQLRQRWQ